ncbi:hypothetical protein SO802_025401 [Lithocarpus litseifolius]|uniref:Uncharacterized protein n=1 Tax=Lithocarpus litseifolius TaxID=425828 RepID=A0AAW2BYE9_9ROSI
MRWDLVIAWLAKSWSLGSILRGFSATRFVLEFSLIALRATSRWPLQQLKPAEPSDVLVWLRELIQDLSYIRLAFNGSAMVSIIRDFKFMYQARTAQSMSCLWIRNQISIQFPIRLNCWI